MYYLQNNIYLNTNFLKDKYCKTKKFNSEFLVSGWIGAT